MEKKAEKSEAQESEHLAKVRNDPETTRRINHLDKKLNAAKEFSRLLVILSVACIGFAPALRGLEDGVDLLRTIVIPMQLFSLFCGVIFHRLYLDVFASLYSLDLHETFEAIKTHLTEATAIIDRLERWFEFQTWSFMLSFVLFAGILFPWHIIPWASLPPTP